MRRDRAARAGVAGFLYDRAFLDCLDRLADIDRPFPAVLLAGCPNPDWPERIPHVELQIVDPGDVMASRVGGQRADLETLPFDSGRFDLCLCVGLLETANHLPLALAAVHFVLKPGGLLLGATAGGESFPLLRRAMLAADAIQGQAAPHVHPRVEAPGLAHLLTSAGFSMPVVDVDRVAVTYRSFDHLVRDLRAMSCTNILSSRSRRPLGRAALAAARESFAAGQQRVTEKVDILHFAAWANS